MERDCREQGLARRGRDLVPQRKRLLMGIMVGERHSWYNGKNVRPLCKIEDESEAEKRHQLEIFHFLSLSSQPKRPP